MAARAAQAYCDRWQIETSFQAVKQEFALEKARVRTFRRLENIFSLCILAYVFATDFLRRAKGFRKVLKFLSDNLETVSLRTHALARWHTRARGRAAASVHKREAAESQAKGRAADGVRALRRPERGPPDRARSRQEAFSRGETPGGAYPQPACMAKTGPKTGPGRRFFAWESAIEESPCQFLTPLKIFLSQCFQGCDAISG